MTAAQAEHTSVLAVGLERYDGINFPDLPGAGTHAIRFAQWAAAEGVPTGRIRLACSWSDPGAAETVFGAVEVGTTRDHMEAALHMLMDEGGDLLLIYWCGHGVTEEHTKRVLFTSNANGNTMANIPVGEIQRLVTSTKGRGFGQVVVLIDACANFVEHMNGVRGLPGFTFGQLDSRETPLFMYFSTDLGQIAEFDKQLRRATFSTHLLQWLDGHRGQGLPPDLDRLRRDVDADFTKRALSGMLRQSPVSVIVRTVKGSEDDVTYSSWSESARLEPSQRRLMVDRVIASDLLNSNAQPQDIKDILGADGSLESRVARAFAHGRGDRLIQAMNGLVGGNPIRALAMADVQTTWQRQLRTAPLLRAFPRVTGEQVVKALHHALPANEVCRARDLAGAVDVAAAKSPLRPGGVDALHRMVVTLEQLTATFVSDEWFHLDEGPLAQLREDSVGWAITAPTQVFIDLRSGGSPGGLKNLPSRVTAHVRRKIAGVLQWERFDKTVSEGHGVVTLDAIKVAVDQLMHEVYSIGETSFTVGFIVPRVLQDELPEAWPLTRYLASSKPIGIQHPAVLHSAERLSAARIREGAKSVAEWRRRAADVRTAIGAAQPTVAWVGEELSQSPEGVRDIVEELADAVIALQFVPGEAGDDLAADPIIGAVMAGAPYVMWTQSAPEDWESLVRQVCDIVEQGPFVDVARRVHQLRRQHPEKLGTGLRVIWDDPDSLSELLSDVPKLLGAGTFNFQEGLENG